MAHDASSRSPWGYGSAGRIYDLEEAVRTAHRWMRARAARGEPFLSEGRASPGFDFGNSPFEVSKVDFQGKTIIQRTSAGTQGIVVAAHRAERLYASSLVTADATVRAMLAASPDQITLIAMGDNGVDRTDEDEVCAIHLRNRLEGQGQRSRGGEPPDYGGWRSLAVSRSGATVPVPRGCRNRARYRPI